MDERYDFQRSVTDGRYVYLRNYMPHLPAGQHVEYMFQTKTTQVWKNLFDAGKLNETQSMFFKAPRRPEELYDLQTDPDEVRNLAGAPKHRDVLDKLGKAQRDHALAIRDVGFLPEDEIHTRSAKSTPYQMARDPIAKAYPLDRILAAATAASSLEDEETPKLFEALRDADSAVRYWATLGLFMRGRQVVTDNLPSLRKLAKNDASPYVRLTAAEALAQHGPREDFDASLQTIVGYADPAKNSIYVRLAALNALDRLGTPARAALATIKAWPEETGKERGAAGIPRLVSKIVTQVK
jgi:uncharacterized sulfatase